MFSMKILVRVSIYIIIAFTLSLVISYLSAYNHKHYGCLIHEEVYKQQIEAKVERNFVDTPNHSIRKVIYKDETGKENVLVYTPEYRDMFDSLKVGDSIFKQPGAITYQVKSNRTKKTRVFKFYTFCKDSIR